MNANIGRLSRELAELAAFSDVPNPAVTRVLYTDQDLKARAFLKRLGSEAGLSVRDDAIGMRAAGSRARRLRDLHKNEHECGHHEGGDVGDDGAGDADDGVEHAGDCGAENARDRAADHLCRVGAIAMRIRHQHGDRRLERR